MNIDKNFNLQDNITNNIKWINPISSDRISIYGFNWIKEDRIYRRLPLSSFSKIEESCPKINQLSNYTSGGQIHFWTNSKNLYLKAKIKDKASISLMSAITQAGFDCYVGPNYDNLLFYNTANFNVGTSEYQSKLFNNEVGKKLVVLNFPLYGAVEEVLLGIDDNSYVEKPNEFDSKGRIVIYGTSITQGGCASRPGLSFTNILSRRLKREFLNYGFSGNAFGEIEIANIIASIQNVKMFILDYEANGGTNGKLALTLENFIKTIRLQNPGTPIVVMSRIKYLFDDLNKDLGKRRAKIRQFQIDMVKYFNNIGDHDVYFIDGSKLLGKDYHEYTVDSIHPNDLGFMKIANNLENKIKAILNE